MSDQEWVALFASMALPPDRIQAVSSAAWKFAARVRTRQSHAFQKDQLRGGSANGIEKG